MIFLHRWSSNPPTCSPITCGYPHVEDVNAVVKRSSYNVERSQGAKIGDGAIVECSPGYQMMMNISSTRIQAVDQVHVICNTEGIWEKPHAYFCLEAGLVPKVTISYTIEIQSLVFCSCGLTLSF